MIAADESAGTPLLSTPPGTLLRLLNEALLRGSISARGVDKVLRVAWTLADLGGHDRISERDIRSALLLRQGAARELAS